MIKSVELGWVYRYGAGAGSPAGEILNPHSHIAGAGAGAPVDQKSDPHPSGLKSADAHIHGCNCQP